jgi:hypothetical protein
VVGIGFEGFGLTLEAQNQCEPGWPAADLFL